MFLGLLGADQCYLGFWRAAVLMLATLGGSVCGISTTLLFGFCPVYGWDMYRLAIDLPLWQFLIILIAVLFFIAFAIGGLPVVVSELHGKDWHYSGGELAVLIAACLAASATAMLL